ncbi:DUF4440 domain-containing protein [Streptomyces sp. NPDC059814]|uniref:YybH family protein n=1 Tax=Streptomyces sp. NPDC059814 TaxID=3346959 RepID=UPI003661AD8E
MEDRKHIHGTTDLESAPRRPSRRTVPKAAGAVAPVTAPAFAAAPALTDGTGAGEKAAHDRGKASYARGGWGLRKPCRLTSLCPEALAACGRVAFASGDLANGWPDFLDGAVESGLRAAGQPLGPESRKPPGRRTRAGTTARPFPFQSPSQRGGPVTMAYDFSTDFDPENPDLTSDTDTQNEIFLQAFNSGDGAIFNSLYRENSVSNFSGEPLTGAARLAFFKEFLAAKPSLKAEVTHAHVAGDVALIGVEYSIDTTGKDGEPVHLEGVCTDVLRRGDDGRWLMAIDRPVAATGLVAAE